MLIKIRPHLYLVVMIISAALSLSRILLVAYIMPAEEFTKYAMIIAAGAFFSYVLSFGIIEATIKKFPRYFLDNSFENIFQLGSSICFILFKRLLLYFFLASLLYLTSSLDIFLFFCLSVCISFANATVNLVSSIQRSLYNMNHFSKGSILRASVVFITVIITANLFGYIGVIIAEILAILVGSFMSQKIARATVNKISESQVEKIKNREVTKEVSVDNSAGRHVFYSFLFLSVPFYLDRLFINSFYSSADSASYAFLVILISGSAVLVNIVSQKVGPEIIRLERNNSTVKKQILYACKWSMIPVIAWCGLISIVLMMINFNVQPSIFEKYNLNGTLVLSVGFLGLFQITSIFEFLFLANNNEKYFFGLSLSYTLAVFLIALLCVYQSQPLHLLVIYMAMAKMTYLASIIKFNLLKVVT